MRTSRDCWFHIEASSLKTPHTLGTGPMVDLFSSVSLILSIEPGAE